MNPNDERQPFGVIFVGPPGEFAAWLVTPAGHFMDRETVEIVGQFAVRAGAADYRPFPLDDEQLQRIAAMTASRDSKAFVDGAHLDELQRLLAECGGVPMSTHQPMKG